MKCILFVCVENACRSQIAEGFFNKFACEKAIAHSAGTKIAKEINPNAIEVMKEVGIDISNQRPKLLTQEMIEKADKIITMGCGVDTCPANFLPKIEDWNIEDPAGKSIEKFREIRDEIKNKVQMLLKEFVEE